MIVLIREKLKNGNEKIDNRLKIIFETLFNNFDKNPYHYSYFANIKEIYNYIIGRVKEK